MKILRQDKILLICENMSRQIASTVIVSYHTEYNLLNNYLILFKTANEKTVASRQVFLSFLFSYSFHFGKIKNVFFVILCWQNDSRFPTTS